MNKALVVVFIIAFVLRLCTLFVGYHGDLNNNISWGTSAFTVGLNGFYQREDFQYSVPNQPPLTILMFAGLRFIWQLTENTTWWLNNNFKIFPSAFIWFWEQKGMILLVKLPSILADLGIAWLIFKFFKQKNNTKSGLVITSLWLFNPVIWYNSSIWGQTDSIVNLLGLISVIALLNKRLYKFSIYFTASVLFKGSLLVFTPIFLFAVFRQKYALSKMAKALLLSFCTIFISSIWFNPKPDLLIWVFNLYKNRILPGEIGYLTANAFNFWWLVNSGSTLDSTVYFGLPARFWGFGIVFALVIVIIVWLKKTFSKERMILSFVILSLATFLFLTRIHERYLYPFFPYATLSLAMTPLMWVPYLVLSATHLLNLYHLFWVPPIPFLESLYRLPIFAQLISLINIATFLYMLRLLRASKI